MPELFKSLAVVTEVMGLNWSEAAIEFIAEELRLYPLSAVQQALKACVHECRGKLTLADIINRLPGGHPGAEEAWAMVSRCMNNEALTLVWTDEMREAYGVAHGVDNDEVGARMAFKEIYLNAVRRSREEGNVPKWSVSQGTDHPDRERAILEGVKQGRLTVAYAQRLLPHPEDPQTVALLESLCPKLLGLDGPEENNA